MNTDPRAVLRATVVYAQPERQWVVALRMPVGATIGEAVEQSGLRRLCPELAGPELELGVFHRRRPPQTALRDGDRIEIYRPLLIDAKQARRLRAAGRHVRRANAKGSGP